MEAVRGTKDELCPAEERELALLGHTERAGYSRVLFHSIHPTTLFMSLSPLDRGRRGGSEGRTYLSD